MTLRDIDDAAQAQYEKMLAEVGDVKSVLAPRMDTPAWQAYESAKISAIGRAMLVVDAYRGAGHLNLAIEALERALETLQATRDAATVEALEEFKRVTS